jgi:hypothetical protein
MILKAVAARQANSQILAASSMAEVSEKAKLPWAILPCPNLFNCSTRSDRKNAQHPIKHSRSQDNPPNLVLMGASAKVSAKKAKASGGKGLRDNTGVQWDHKFCDLKL